MPDLPRGRVKNTNIIQNNVLILITSYVLILITSSKCYIVNREICKTGKNVIFDKVRKRITTPFGEDNFENQI